jgi:hypothetical protein
MGVRSGKSAGAYLVRPELVDREGARCRHRSGDHGGLLREGGLLRDAGVADHASAEGRVRRRLGEVDVVEEGEHLSKAAARGSARAGRSRGRACARAPCHCGQPILPLNLSALPHPLLPPVCAAGPAILAPLSSLASLHPPMQGVCPERRGVRGPCRRSCAARCSAEHELSCRAAAPPRRCAAVRRPPRTWCGCRLMSHEHPK